MPIYNTPPTYYAEWLDKYTDTIANNIIRGNLYRSEFSEVFNCMHNSAVARAYEDQMGYENHVGSEKYCAYATKLLTESLTDDKIDNDICSAYDWAYNRFVSDGYDKGEFRARLGDELDNSYNSGYPHYESSPPPDERWTWGEE